MPISTTPLIHRNIQVWLADAEDHKIPHGETAIDGNTISTSVSLVKGTDYVIHWRNYPGTAHTVSVKYLFTGRKAVSQTHFMDKDKPETQTRSSLGRINALITGSQGNDWLSAPTPSKRAYVELHIRRATGTPTHECVPNPADPAGHLDEIAIELIDDPDEDKDPFIIFRFEFGPATKPEPDRNAIAGPSKSTVPQKRKQPVNVPTVCAFTSWINSLHR
ncbi:hypothetical protein B0H14DRAFT_2688366 [Mycena olivaceomarginata]|nr:hypothetical protein B0H14DRAFT_2688366 [Mycena olivaceomarginata]